MLNDIPLADPPPKYTGKRGNKRWLAGE